MSVLIPGSRNCVNSDSAPSSQDSRRRPAPSQMDNLPHWPPKGFPDARVENSSQRQWGGPDQAVHDHPSRTAEFRFSNDALQNELRDRICSAGVAPCVWMKVVSMERLRGLFPVLTPNTRMVLMLYFQHSPEHLLHSFTNFLWFLNNIR